MSYIKLKDIKKATNRQFDQNKQKDIKKEEKQTQKKEEIQEKNKKNIYSQDPVVKLPQLGRCFQKFSMLAEQNREQAQKNIEQTINKVR